MSDGFDELIDEHLSTFDTSYIESFNELVARSVDQEFAKIEKQYESHKKRIYDDPQHEFYNGTWIQDDGVFMGIVSNLAHELSIVALYKQLEIKQKEIIAFHKRNEDTKKYSYWKNVLSVLPDTIKNSDGFMSVNELRLLNNSIKHEGVVSEELSNEFPSYGNKGEELSNLNEAFIRLKPKIVSYVNELHHAYKQIT